MPVKSDLEAVTEALAALVPSDELGVFHLNLDNGALLRFCVAGEDSVMPAGEAMVVTEADAAADQVQLVPVKQFLQGEESRLVILAEDDFIAFAQFLLSGKAIRAVH